jgi:hypothetical protein
MSTLGLIGHVVLVGIGATAVMDAWLVVLSRLGVPTGSFAMIGRWVGHMAHGRLAHVAIAKAPAVRNELGLGWLTHYAVGIAYAALLVAVMGVAWLEQPAFLSALGFGLATVAAPWFVMQPAMGLGLERLTKRCHRAGRLSRLTHHGTKQEQADQRGAMEEDQAAAAAGQAFAEGRPAST